MSYTVRELRDEKIWKQFLYEQKPNTFLHSWNWGEFHKKMGYKLFRLALFDNENLVSVALIIKIVARRGSFLFCPHGPIIRSEMQETKSKILNILTDY